MSKAVKKKETDESVREFKLPYYLAQTCDGSARLVMAKSIEAARVHEDEEEEPFAEHTADEIRLRFKDGRLWVYSDNGLNHFWVLVPEV